jgi:GT2 family glycosyltransferase
VPDPAVAIVVVTYDSADVLGDTLGRVSAQMRPGDELVVVDNGSSDASASAARAAAPEARVIELGENTGFAAACHTGADATSAPLLFLLNPDSRLAPGCLDALRRAGDGQPAWGAWQALVLLPGGTEINSRGGEIHWLGFGWAGGCGRPLADAPPEPKPTGFASGAALMVRREAWDAVGGFDPAYFMYGEDLDLSLRLRVAGWDVGVVPAARVEHDYSFAKGDYKWFYLERNRWWTVIGAYPGPLLLLVLPALLAFDVALLAVAAREGWLAAKLRAQRAVLRSLPWALRRRRRTRARTRRAPVAIESALTTSLDSPFLSPPAPALVRLQAGYWTAVRMLLRAST